jgi:hypothetical protein
VFWVVDCWQAVEPIGYPYLNAAQAFFFSSGKHQDHLYFTSKKRTEPQIVECHDLGTANTRIGRSYLPNTIHRAKIFEGLCRGH